jgi:hypothetical protein
MNKEQFWQRTERQKNGCLLWTGARVGKYGDLYWKGRRTRPHIVSFKMHHGRIPKGKWVCHTCDTPLCIEPSHLFAGTPRQNTQDAIAKGRYRFIGLVHKAKTHCPQGHKYSESNTYVDPKEKRRQCRICKMAWRQRAARKQGRSAA